MYFFRNAQHKVLHINEAPWKIHLMLFNARGKSYQENANNFEAAKDRFKIK